MRIARLDNNNNVLDIILGELKDFPGSVEDVGYHPGDKIDPDTGAILNRPEKVAVYRTTITKHDLFDGENRMLTDAEIDLFLDHLDTPGANKQLKRTLQRMQMRTVPIDTSSAQFAGLMDLMTDAGILEPGRKEILILGAEINV